MKKFALILLVLLPLFWASFASPQPAFGATITVDTLTDKNDGVGACSLREAIQNANDDAATFANCTAGTGADIIDFSVSGTINFTLGSSIFVTDADGLVIDGGGNIGLDGGGSPSGTRLLDVTGVLTLDNITIQNGYNSGAGGAISTTFTSDLTITNSYFTNNVADGNGGALLVGGALTITDSVFETNSAGGDGGAIHFSATPPMNITNVAFIGNSAGNNSGNIDGSGGAIWHNGAVAVPSSITGSYFLSNQVLNAESADGGGAIYHGTAGILAITASAFFGNDASGDDARGGAIYNNSGDDFAMTINYSHFGELLGVGVPPIPPIIIPGASFNIVAAIGANGAGNTVSGTSDATAGGGAIYNNGYLLMNGVSLIANTSSNHGGAFMNTRTTPDPFPQPLGQQVIISNSTFSLNTATNNGGAIYHGNSFIPNDNLMEIRNVTIADNNVISGLGDGIFNLGDGESPGFSNFDDFYLVNTIIVNDSCAGGSLGAINTSGTGNNVVFGGSCTILLQDGGSTGASTITADPVLSAPELAFNLANIFTVVRSLGPSSSASGTGDNGVCTSFPVLSLDQRNLPLGFRPQGAPACDIGAYESDQVALPEINVRDGTDTTDIVDGDPTPDTGDGTDFGTTPVGTPVVQNFIIQNQGGADLSITAIVPPAGFTVGAFPSIIAGESEIVVQVTCTAATAGIYSGDLIIQNNDSDENPYNFAITCEVEGPEITVTGLGGNNVANGSAASLVNGSDFGTIPQSSPLTRTFTIENTGVNLNLDVTSIAFVGAGTGFSLTLPSLPASFAPTNQITFDVECTAVSGGLFTETITIANNDSNENPFTFDIRCDVTASGPQIEVFGNSSPINDGGGNSPALLNDTDFGALAVGNITTNTRTYTITNTGTADLTINNLITSGAGFSLFTPPSGTITAGNSTSFVIACDTSAPNSYIGSVEIVNNTSAPTDSYTFNLACLVAEPDIRVSKAENTDPVNAGSPIIYTVSIQNMGLPALDATNVVLTEVLPLGFTANTVTPSQGTCPATPLTGTFNCNIGTIIAGNTVTVAITGTYDPSTPNGSSRTNEAYVNYDGFTTGSAGTDADGDDERAIEETTVNASADVGVTKTVDNPTPVEGGTIVYTIVVENFGPSTATSVNLTDSLPIGVTGTGAFTGTGCSFTAPTLSCSIPSLLPGATFTATVTATVDVGASAISPITNTANINSTSSDTNGSNDSSSVDINATATAPEINVQGNGVDIANGDNTPSVTDDTDFGATLFGMGVTNTFTIQNVGSQSLSITGAVTVTNPTNFSVTLQPAATIGAGLDSTFDVTCTAANTGTHVATVTIPNDDSDENPFTFDVSCTVNSPTPLIEVRGLGNVIVDGVIAPNLVDGTLFPTTSPGVPVSRTFEIRNIGTGGLTVSISGAPLPVPFTLTTAPAATVFNGTPTTFTIECDPPANGNYTLTITIDNNDTTTPGANPFTFGIECVATTAGAPEINVRGNGVSIISGDVTPDLADHTDFGSTSETIPSTRTFTIENTGLGDLTLGLITVPAGFTITGMPTSPVAAGGNTTLGITCDATAQGTYSGTVSIVNDDSDENPYTFAIRCIVNPAGTNADLSLSKIVSDTTPQFGDIITYTVTVNNVGPGATTGVQVVDTFPTSVTFLAVGTVSQGTVTVDGSNLFLTWDIGTMANPATVTLTYTVQVNPTVGTTNNYAEITVSTAPDPNSTPGNGIPPTPIEDDEAAIAFLFDPPFGDKAFVYDGVSVVTWTVIWVNPSTQPIAVSMSDPLLGGTTFVSGSLTCTALGASVTTTCLHNAVTNTIEFTGTIAPNPGATIADVNTASNRLVITYSVVVPDGVDSVANTATLTDTDNDVVVTVTETFTRTTPQPTPPPPTGGTPPLTTEEINAKVTALPATGETPLWADLLRVGLMTGVALGGAGAVWMLRRRRASA